MSDYVKRVNGVADQYLAALAESQEQFLKNMATFSAWVPKVPAPSAPDFAAGLPTPKEIVEANFAFATKLLKQQKEFTEKLVAATTSTN
jgi:hypothetical protein